MAPSTQQLEVAPTRTRGVRAIAAGVAIAALAAVAGVSATSIAAASPPTSSPTPSAVGAPDAGAIDTLTAGLLTADELGVPPDWVIRDADSSVLVDTVVLGDLDPFQGLLTCPAGTLGVQPEGLWVARRYSSPEVPMENGLLSVDVIIAEDPATTAATNQAALAGCAAGEQDQLAVGSTTLRPAGGDIEAATLELLAAASGAVAYPSAYNATVASADGRTVTVVLGGVDMGASWQPFADDIATAALDQLSAPSPPASAASMPAPAPSPPTT